MALRRALTAQRMLAEDWGVSADVWSATSWTELRRDALACEAWNMLHPGRAVPGAVRELGARRAPGPGGGGIRLDRAVPDQIARWVPGTFTSLGTDGFGFSDTRPRPGGSSTWTPNPSRVAVLWELARSGEVDADLPAQAIAKYRLDLPVSEALS